MATIIDVARRAGVSTATVSAVINGKDWVSAPLRQSVHQAIEAVGYRPNAIARSLKRGRSGTIGMLVSDITNPFFSAVFQVVNRIAYENSYSVILCSSDESADQEEEFIRVLSERMIDGLILAPSAHDEACAELLAGAKMPVVLIDRILPMSNFDAVVIDNYAATKGAISYMLSLGHERIGFVSGPEGLWTASERYRGYKDALLETGRDLDETIIVSGGFNQAGGYRAATEIMASSRPPSAIFASNNKMIIGVVLALNSAGFRCPDDISLSSFDDFEWAPAFHPALTVVRQPIEQIAAEAMTLLLSRMNATEAPEPAQIRRLHAEFVIRGSCQRFGMTAKQEADGS